jgi:hypothetical protein
LTAQRYIKKYYPANKTVCFYIFFINNYQSAKLFFTFPTNFYIYQLPLGSLGGTLVERKLLYKRGETKSVKYLFSDAE